MEQEYKTQIIRDNEVLDVDNMPSGEFLAFVQSIESEPVSSSRTIPI